MTSLLEATIARKREEAAAAQAAQAAAIQTKLDAEHACLRAWLQTWMDTWASNVIAVSVRIFTLSLVNPTYASELSAPGGAQRLLSTCAGSIVAVSAAPTSLRAASKQK